MGLSIRAYAQHRGVSHTAVAKAIKAGRISKEPDGTIDPAKADAQWVRNTLPSQNLNTGASKPAPKVATPPVSTPVATGSSRELQPPGLQRACLPGRHLAHHLIGDAADEVGRNVHRVHLKQESLNLAHRHATGVHGDDFVVKAAEAALVLADELGLKCPSAVSGDFDGQRAAVRQYRLGALAIAVVGYACGFGLARRIAQMLAQLGPQCAFDEGLLEPLENVFELRRRHLYAPNCAKQAHCGSTITASCPANALLPLCPCVRV